MYDRRNTNAAAIRAIEQHPLAGVGWVQFVSRSGEFVRQDDDYPVTVTSIEIHNVALSRAAELGIPGGALWVLTVLLGPGAAALRRSGTPASATWRVVTIGAGSAWAVSVLASPLPYPLPNTLIWLFSGLALAPTLLKSPPQPRDDVHY